MIIIFIEYRQYNDKTESDKAKFSKTITQLTRSDIGNRKEQHKLR